MVRTKENSTHVEAAVAIWSQVNYTTLTCLCSIRREIPKATPLNHQNVMKRIEERTTKAIASVFVVTRFEEKKKWSRTCESMRTAK